MKKFSIILISALIISSIYYQFNPVKDVRYNTYDKTINCYNEGSFEIPEGCAESVKPTVAQTWADYVIIMSSLGLIGIGIARFIKILMKKQS